jgi:hypothetical protein
MASGVDLTPSSSVIVAVSQITNPRITSGEHSSDLLQGSSRFVENRMDAIVEEDKSHPLRLEQPTMDSLMVSKTEPATSSNDSTGKILGCTGSDHAENSPIETSPSAGEEEDNLVNV